MKQAFLALPVSEQAQSGLVMQDTYLSMKQIEPGIDASMRVVVMMPSAGYIIESILLPPNQCAAEVFPDILTQYYHAVVIGKGFSTRPALILVDDVILADFLRADLKGSGTEIRSVNERTYHIDTYTTKKVPLHEVAMGLCIKIQQLVRGNTSVLGQHVGKVEESRRTKGKYKVDSEQIKSTFGDLPPISHMHTCNYNSCGRILTGAKMCSRCMLAFYCCQEHQKKDWEVHKIGCKKIEKDTASNQVDVVQIARPPATQTSIPVAVGDRVIFQGLVGRKDLNGGNGEVAKHIMHTTYCDYYDYDYDYDYNYDYERLLLLLLLF